EPGLQLSGPRAPPADLLEALVEHHHHRDRAAASRGEMRVHQVQVLVAAQDPQLELLGDSIGQPREPRHRVERVTTPVLEQHQQVALARQGPRQLQERLTDRGARVNGPPQLPVLLRSLDELRERLRSLEPTPHLLLPLPLCTCPGPGSPLPSIVVSGRLICLIMRRNCTPNRRNRSGACRRSIRAKAFFSHAGEQSVRKRGICPPVACWPTLPAWKRNSGSSGWPPGCGGAASLRRRRSWTRSG